MFTFLDSPRLCEELEIACSLHKFSGSVSGVGVIADGDPSVGDNVPLVN